MRRICVIAADAARARFLRLTTRETPDGRRAPVLEEVEDLVNPEARLRASEVLSESRPGSRRAGPEGPAHAVDDRRDANADEQDRRFAEAIAAAGEAFTRRVAPRLVVVVAPPELLGHLRRYTDRLGGEVVEVPEDLTRLSPVELHDHLAAHHDGVLPGRDARFA